MSAAKTHHKIYNIPAGIAFARALAAQLIAETKATPDTLATYRIFLPTRRAARVLQQAFLDENNGEPLLLPRLLVLGDIDEEELSLSAAGSDMPEALDIPPALPPLRRQVLLARTVQAIPGYTGNFDQAILLAGALGRLMDQVHTENLSLEALPALAPEDFADHWQITLKFMTVLSEAWPKILLSEGMIEAADRRNRFLNALSAHWQANPPQTPVIAAGTTGSIPATAELLRVIATMPQGRIVLPGFDTGMDTESWEALGESHPQYGLRHLLHTLGIEKEQVLPWPGTEATPLTRARTILASEIMRPPETTGNWSATLPLDETLRQEIAAATQNLCVLDCANEREEAAAIAVLLREALETPGRTAALITPRRSLARRVAATCQRWDLAIDDSAGQTLDQSMTGQYLRLCAEAAASDYSPVALLALLKHPFSKAENIHALDLALRGPAPAPGLDGIKDRDQAGLLRSIEPILTRFNQGSTPGKPRNIEEIIEAHLDLAEALAGGPDSLWSRDDGEAAALFFTQLRQQTLFPPLSLNAYSDILTRLLKTVTIRPGYGAHPRLHILGQLEARMIDADLIIMAGLNEKSWPPDPGHDPWMSRPMRKQFGLPGPERAIGLAAHDFVQGFCNKDVILTRSLRQDGAPAVPARWLQRLEAVLEAAGLPGDILATCPAVSWANKLDESPVYEPLRRPEPRPPLAARPRSLFVTQIEKWQQDPYGVYARHVLRLKPLKPLEKPVKAADKGDMLHKILNQFVRQYPEILPANAAAKLEEIAATELEQRHDNPADWSFWCRRFARTAAWLTQHETGWRETARPAATEAEGKIEIPAAAGPFMLRCYADRIDTLPGGTAIIDYKSGGDYPEKQIVSGKLPQLPLEGLILSRGGFDKLGPLKPLSLQYWKLTGGETPGEIKGIHAGVETAVAAAEAGLLALVNAFDNEQTPYYSLPRPENAPRFNDYKHLARVAEWAAQGNDDASEGI